MDIYAYEQINEKLEDILANQEDIKEKLGIKEKEEEDLDDGSDDKDIDF